MSSGRPLHRLFSSKALQSITNDIFPRSKKGSQKSLASICKSCARTFRDAQLTEQLLEGRNKGRDGGRVQIVLVCSSPDSCPLGSLLTRNKSISADELANGVALSVECFMLGSEPFDPHDFDTLIFARKGPVLELEISVSKESPASSYISTRPIQHNLNSTSTFTQVKSWITDCHSHHEKCSHRRFGSTMPSRMIDVKNCLTGTVEISPTDGIQVNYLALSYCWGTAHSAVLTQESLSDWTSKGVSMASLSQTIQDAITVTHSLNIPYIWVDALCIIQDSPEDLERELIKMESVYANALLTIIVADTVSSEGFLNPQQQDQQNSEHVTASPFHIPFAGPVGDMMPLIAEQSRPYGRNRRINTRAWTLQERLLSRRLLIFENSPNRLYWKCGSQLLSAGGIQPSRFHSADDNLLPPQFFDQGTGTGSNTTTQTLSVAGTANKPTHAKKISSPMDIQQKWRDIVIDYSPRQIGKDSDRLHAIASLAAKFQKVLPAGTSYAAGHWLDPRNECRLFFYSLTWEYVARPRKPGGYVAPSWSWAGSYGGVVWRGNEDMGKGMGRCFCSVVRWLPQLRFETLPYGQLVEGCCLEVQGYLFATTLRFDKEWGGYQFDDVQGVQHEISLDDGEIGEREVWRLPLFEGIGLLLQKVNGGEEFRRVGIYRRAGFEGERWLQDFVKEKGLDDWVAGGMRGRVVLI